jgi:GT2 family glycosyltransferase
MNMLAITPIPVVIPVYGREDVFPTMALLRSQEYVGSLRFIVVDNGNGPELSARLAALAGDDCRIVRFEENRGGSAAYIAGMDFARKNYPESPYVWLLDDDAKPNAQTLPALVETMERLVAENPHTASVGSTVVSVKDTDHIVECGASFSPLLGHAFPKLSGGSLTDVGDCTLLVDYAAACSLLVNVAAVESCGFWENVFIHFDDIEWGLRVTKAGWRNYATTASTVVHPEFDPEKAGPWVCYFDSRNMLWLASKYGPLHVAAVKCKDFLKNLRARLMGCHRERIPYRKLAHADFKAGIRRTRTEVISAVEGTSAIGT